DRSFRAARKRGPLVSRCRRVRDAYVADDALTTDGVNEPRPSAAAVRFYGSLSVVPAGRDRGVKPVRPFSSISSLTGVRAWAGDRSREWNLGANPVHRSAGAGTK